MSAGNRFLACEDIPFLFRTLNSIFIRPNLKKLRAVMKLQRLIKKSNANKPVE